MDQQWLDSLSEDWVSEPRSSPPASLPNSTPSDASIAGQSFKSRIPRCKQRRSLSSVEFSSVSRNPTRPKDAGEESGRALSERSLSDINIPCRSIASTKINVDGEGTSPRRGRKLSRTVSGSAGQSLKQRTVQYTSVSCSPDKSKHNHETPEWRRRLVLGQVAYGEQRDLFGPSGLESIFQPPNSQQEQQKQGKRRGAMKFMAQENIPSSPPPYPSITQQLPNSSAQIQSEKSIGTQKLAVLREEEEALSRNTSRQCSKEIIEDIDDSKDPAEDDADPNLGRSSNFNPVATSTWDRAHDGGRPNSTRGLPRGASDNSEWPITKALKKTSMEESSASDATKVPTARMRTASGLEEERNEGISPIFVSRQSTVDGRIDYAALNQSMDQMRAEIRNLSLIDKERKDEEPTHLTLQDNHQDARVASPSGIQSGDLTSQSLPGDLTMGTEEFVSRGGFINVRRGGYSNEGSFRHRNLSPSSLPSPSRSTHHGSIFLNDERTRRGSWPCTSEDGTPLPAAPTPPSLFKTPTKTQSHQVSTPEKSRSSGSPLKLFGPYDTFTNERLLRRMSQFENSYPSDEDESKSPFKHDIEDPIASDKSDIRTNAPLPSQSHTRAHVHQGHSRQRFRLSSFGDGLLDDYEFEKYNRTDDAEQSQIFLRLYAMQSQNDKESYQSRYDKARQALRTSPSLRNHKNDVIGGLHAHQTATTSVKAQGEVVILSKSSMGDTEGKRPPTSPVKDPTPKRRRTLCKSDFCARNDQNVSSPTVKDAHHEMQKVIGMKRKDACYGASQSTATPAIIAPRRILRPRTLTLSQSRHKGTNANSEHTAIRDKSILQKEGDEKRYYSRNESIETEAEAQAGAVAKELAAFAVNVGQPNLDDNRKRSATTQDFLDEAVKIMEIIRAKGRPQSGLTSVEESESERHEGDHEDAIMYDSDSTREPFTRPPSRDGLSVPKPRKHEQQDPRVLSHLRKFEEKEEASDILVSSIRSLRLADKAQSTAIEELQELESQPPNIRIHHKQQHEHGSSVDISVKIPQVQVQSMSSASSTYPSSGRTNPTGTSSSSATRHVIAQDKVSHLIPGEVAGMTYDAAKKAWVKQKDSCTGERDVREKSISDGSEQDPFRDIPDLTVDDIEELRRINAIAAKQSEHNSSSQKMDSETKAPLESQHSSDENPEGSVIVSRPSTRQHSDESKPDSGSFASKASQLRSSGPRTETRATSWSEDGIMPTEQKAAPLQHSTRSNGPLNVEHEIGIHEDRSPTTPLRSFTRTRNITVAFSSPVVSQFQHDQDFDPKGIPTNMTNASAIDIEESIVEHSLQIEQLVEDQRRGSTSASVLVTPGSTHHSVTRRFSLGGRAFTARAVSRIEERIEESFQHLASKSREQSLHLVHSTPLSRPAVSGSIATPLPPHNSTSYVSYRLSPLSDFTINQYEPSFHANHNGIAKRQIQSSSNEAEHKYALITQELVKNITDVEPYEPYWEHLKQLDLSSKNLESLQMLSQFCDRLERLDVSDNGIGQLSGVPSTVRNLRIQRNHLSGLTNWNHLTNLQYLDISGNQVESLEGFRDLVHLRELKADDNKITSLEGVLDLDGLLSLKVRRNQLVTVDFEATEMTRLTELDLSGNKLSEIRNLHSLPALVHLCLDDNEIRQLIVEKPFVLSALRSLKVINNQLEALDVSAMPDLRILYVDRNKLSEVDGIQCAKYLDSVSMREQTSASNEEELSLMTDDCFEVRKLYLSGNLFRTFAPQTDFLNLQYLELASSGVERLPQDFGQMLTNVRVLNLNFNAISDIRPLLGIRRLKKLLLAGNRLCKVRRATAILSRFDSLSKLDLRNNPLTVGFYPPMTENRLVVHEGVRNRNNVPTFIEPFTLPEANKEADHAYSSRLDQGTKLKRRVYELLLACGCGRLKSLDGMTFNVEDLLSKDGVWEKLQDLGVVKNSTTETKEVADQIEGMPNNVDSQVRLPVEDEMVTAGV